MVHYVIDAEAQTVLELYNSAGERVLTVDEGVRARGKHAAPIATNKLAAGAYRLRLKYGERTLTIPVEVR